MENSSFSTYISSPNLPRAYWALPFECPNMSDSPHHPWHVPCQNENHHLLPRSENWVLSLTHHSPSIPISKPIDSISLTSLEKMYCSPFPLSSPLLSFHHVSLGLLTKYVLLHSCPSLIDSPYPVPKVTFLKSRLVTRLPCWNILNSRLTAGPRAQFHPKSPVFFWGKGPSSPSISKSAA